VDDQKRLAVAPPVVTLTPRENYALTHELVLNAAMAIFLRDGFYEASTREIAEEAGRLCREAGFLHGAVYHGSDGFDGKDDLFLALFDREVRRRVQRVAGSVVETDSAHDTARTMRTYYEHYLADDRWSLLMDEFATRALRNPEIARRYRELNERLRATGQDLIAKSFMRVHLPLGEQAAIEVWAVLQAVGCGRRLTQWIAPKTSM
jgi:AcrR family transcriptional regulator